MTKLGKRFNTNIKTKALSAAGGILLSLIFSAVSFGMEPAATRVGVAVLGGGMSGLTAAYHLHKRGVPVAIYEGRDRLGGRTNTHYFTSDRSQFFEEGGTDIDDDHKDTIALAKELRVDLTKRGFGMGKISIFDQQKLVSLTDFETELASLDSFFTSLQSEFAAHGNYAEYDLSLKVHYKPLVESVAKSSLSPQSRAFLKTFYESETGVPFDKGVVYHLKWLQEEMKQYHSLLWYRNKPFIPNIAINVFGYKYRVTQGMSHFVGRLRQEVEKTSTINLARKLTHLSRAGDEYALTFESSNGSEKRVEKVIASHVIMTLPFSTLRHVTIDPSLKLPEHTQKAIQTLPYGTNGKIGLKAAGQKNLSDEMLYYVNLNPSVIAWPGQRALTFYLAAQTGRQLNTESAQQIVRDNLPNVQREYPGYQFDTPVVKNWADDEFARGSYSAVTTDMEADLANPSAKHPELRLFAEPLDHDAFIFAGEHTRADGSEAHIEGAVRSGILASKILFERMSRLPKK